MSRPGTETQAERIPPKEKDYSRVEGRLFDPSSFREAATLVKSTTERSDTSAILPDVKVTGIERTVKDGRTEFTVHAGNDSAQNSRWAQEAIRQAERSGGATIKLGEGKYNGGISIRGDNITLKSELGKAVFDMRDRGGTAISIRGKDVVLDGVKIENGRAQNPKEPAVGVGVEGGSERVRLQNLQIQNLTNAHGIRVMTDGKDISDVTIQNSKLTNLKLNQHEAISFMAESGSIRNPRVINNEIKAIDNIGVVMEGSAKGQIRDFEIVGNRISDASSKSNPSYKGERSAAGIQVDTNVVGGKILRNSIERGDHGIVLEREKQGGAVKGITISENDFKNNAVAHILADGSHHSGIAVDGATISNNRYTRDAPLIKKEHPERIHNVPNQQTNEQKKTEVPAQARKESPSDARPDASPALDIRRQTVAPGVTVSAVFTKDEQGKDHAVLRWVERNGKIEQQRDKSGKHVEFHTNYASQQLGDEAVAKLKGELLKAKNGQRSEPESRREPRERPEPLRVEPRDRAPERKEAGGHVRTMAEWNSFYRSQTRGNNCLPTAMSMMYADHYKKSPATDRELQQFERITHVGAHGPYTGSAQDIASQAKSAMPGLQTAVVEGKDRRTMGAELDRHLAQGHTAIVGIKSPYSSGNHYIYVAGKDEHGRYMIGDSGRRGGGKLGPSISRDDLLNRMMDRHGGARMVAGWKQTAEAERTTGERPNAERTERPQPIERQAPASGERREIKLNNALVNIPKDLDPSKPIHFMTYFHGFGHGHEDGYRAANLQETLKNAPPNTVLVSARWQDHDHSRNPAHSQFMQRGGLRGTLNEVFNAIPELQRRNGLSNGDSLGVAGFSAGYNAVGKVLADKTLAPRVNNIVMLDSPSSAVQQYVRDNLSAFADGSKRLTMVAGDWRNADYRAFQQSLEHQLKGDVNRTRGIRFIYTRTPHGEIPAKYFR